MFPFFSRVRRVCRLHRLRDLRRCRGPRRRCRQGPLQLGGVVVVVGGGGGGGGGVVVFGVLVVVSMVVALVVRYVCLYPQNFTKTKQKKNWASGREREDNQRTKVRPPILCLYHNIPTYRVFWGRSGGGAHCS